MIPLIDMSKSPGLLLQAGNDIEPISFDKYLEKYTEVVLHINIREILDEFQEKNARYERLMYQHDNSITFMVIE